MVKQLSTCCCLQRQQGFFCGGKTSGGEQVVVKTAPKNSGKANTTTQENKQSWSHPIPHALLKKEGALCPLVLFLGVVFSLSLSVRLSCRSAHTAHGRGHCVSCNVPCTHAHTHTLVPLFFSRRSRRGPKGGWVVLAGVSLWWFSLSQLGAGQEVLFLFAV